MRLFFLTKRSLIRWALVVLVLLGTVLQVLPARPRSLSAEPLEFMVRAQLSDRLVEGQPLAWSDRQVYLLARDGRLIEFDPEEAQDFDKSAPQYSAYSTSTIRTQLAKEFGRDFEVTATGHYLVVHPRGQRDQWARRFEELYRSFVHYFKVRGFDLQKPKYPLIAVVFRTEEEYRRYAERESSHVGPNTLGHYSPRSNRISLFDITTAGSSRSGTINAETIVHEATHQTAFNTGVHPRFVDVPRWLSEGLATMFEARGVWNSRDHRGTGDRINRERLAEFKHYAATRRNAGNLAGLIATDRPFKKDPHGAYAESWALSYYLCETQPRLYSAYLARTAARPAFEPYTPQQRVSDFTSHFGEDLKLVETQFLRYMQRVE